MDEIKLSQSLLRCASITPQDDGCIKIIADFLSDLDFSCQLMPAAGVNNLWAKRGAGETLFCFAGHVDVVPPGDLTQWNYPPYSATIADNRLYGRGAVDMKGNIAAMLIALRAAINSRADCPTMACIITSDEEGPAQYGTKHIMQQLEKQQEKIRYCLLGEPTSEKSLGDTVKIGRRGSLSLSLKINGKQGHVAYPHKANNSLHMSGDLIHQLIKVRWDNGNKFFPPTTLQIVSCTTNNETMNIIPANTQLKMNWRYGTATSAAKIKSEVEKTCQRLAINADYQWQESAQPFITNPAKFSALVNNSIQKICGQPPQMSTGGGTSDARFIAPYGIEVLELGLFNQTAHQINEHLLIEDLTQLRRIYQEIIEQVINYG